MRRPQPQSLTLFTSLAGESDVLLQRYGWHLLRLMRSSGSPQTLKEGT